MIVVLQLREFLAGGYMKCILNGSLNHIQQFLFHTAKSTELMNEPLATPAPSFRES